MSQGRLADSLSSHFNAEWLLIVVELPGEQSKAVGVILLDIAEDKLFVAVAEQPLQDEDVRDVLTYFKDEVQERASEIGAKAIFDSLEQELSLSIRIDGPRHRIRITDPAETISNLLRHHVLERG